MLLFRTEIEYQLTEDPIRLVKYKLNGFSSYIIIIKDPDSDKVLREAMVCFDKLKENLLFNCRLNIRNEKYAIV